MTKERKLVFPWCSTTNEKEADVVVFGVKDESGSRAHRKGSSAGPDAARASSMKFDVVNRKGQGSSIMYTNMKTGNSRAYDYGNVPKAKVCDFVKKCALSRKAVGCIGGDHSITYEILKGIDKSVGSWGFVYVDAHPDMVGSAGRYYGSVVRDICSLKNVEPKSSFIVGLRAIEKDEVKEIESSGIKYIGIDKVVDVGIVAVAKYIKNLLPENVYVSIDLDSVDPAFAPGVSTPVPGGLESRELLYIASTIGKSVNLGFDVMELNPRYDSGGITAHLASLLMMNMAASVKKR